MDEQSENWQRDPRLTDFMHACCVDTNRAEDMLRESPELLNSPGATVSGETPLHWLAIENECDAARFLIQHGADVNARDRDGDTALTSAAQLGLADMVKLLLAAGADPNAGGMFWRSPLLAAAINERINVDIAGMLLDAGAEVDTRDVLEWTALVYAAELGKADVVQLLLERGADATIRLDPEGTVLHVAAASERCGAEVIALLVKAGADARALDRGNETPYQVAICRGNVAAADVLVVATGEAERC